jgi:hypothetical protein
MGSVVRRCLYPNCEWEHVEPKPELEPAVIEAPFATPVMTAARAAFGTVSFAVERPMIEHLDADHPGWTYDDLWWLMREHMAAARLRQMEATIIDDPTPRPLSPEFHERTLAWFQELVERRIVSYPPLIRPRAYERSDLYERIMELQALREPDKKVVLTSYETHPGWMHAGMEDWPIRDPKDWFRGLDLARPGASPLLFWRLRCDPNPMPMVTWWPALARAERLVRSSIRRLRRGRGSTRPARRFEFVGRMGGGRTSGRGW